MTLKNYKKTIPISNDINDELEVMAKELKIPKYKLVENFLIDRIREFRQLEQSD